MTSNPIVDINKTEITAHHIDIVLKASEFCYDNFKPLVDKYERDNADANHYEKRESKTLSLIQILSKGRYHRKKDDDTSEIHKACFKKVAENTKSSFLQLPSILECLEKALEFLDLKTVFSSPEFTKLEIKTQISEFRKTSSIVKKLAQAYSFLLAYLINSDFFLIKLIGIDETMRFADLKHIFEKCELLLKNCKILVSLAINKIYKSGKRIDLLTHLSNIAFLNSQEDFKNELDEKSCTRTNQENADANEESLAYNKDNSGILEIFKREFCLINEESINKKNNKRLVYWKWDNLKSLCLLEKVLNISGDLKLYYKLMRLGITSNKLALIFKARLLYKNHKLEKCGRTINSLFSYYNGLNGEAKMQFLAFLKRLVTNKNKIEPFEKRNNFWTLVFYYFYDQGDTDLSLFLALEAIRFTEIDCNLAEHRVLVYDAVCLSIQMQKFTVAMTLISKFLSAERDYKLIGHFVEVLYDDDSLDFLVNSISILSADKSDMFVRPLRVLADKEHSSVFVKRILDNRKSNNLASVFGPYGVLILYSLNYKNNSGKNAATYLWGICEKLIEQNIINELDTIKLLTPVVYVLKNFLETNHLPYFKVSKKSIWSRYPESVTNFLYVGHNKSLMDDEPNMNNSNESLKLSCKSTTKEKNLIHTAMIDKVFTVLVSKFVLITRNKSSSAFSDIRRFSKILFDQGFVMLSFNLLQAFERDLTQIFVETAKKCLLVQKNSFSSSRNSSVGSEICRLVSLYDLGTHYSRYSWDLLEALLEKFDKTPSQPYTRAVLDFLLGNSAKHRHWTSFSETPQLQTRLENTSGTEKLTQELSFVPHFLIKRLQKKFPKTRKKEKIRVAKNKHSNNGSTVIEWSEVKNVLDKVNYNFGNKNIDAVKKINDKRRKTAHRRKHCFSYESNAVYLLRSLVRNDFLYQAALMALEYIKNERLRFVKDDKEVWYPRQLIRELMLKLEIAS